MTAWYNEIDEKAAAWLRELIKEGHIAPGVVDTRSIEDIEPHELNRYTQCHFFAGIGVWSYALRMAGWPDSRPVWTGSCPCQPFSAAGKGSGFSDERHLWPAFFHLIQQCDAPIVFGEQVASKDADPWIDLVQTDMEALGRAFGAVAFPSAGVGAPHIRDRAYWVADAASTGSLRGWSSEASDGRGSARLQSERLLSVGDTVRAAGFVVDASRARLAQCIGLGRIPSGSFGTDARQAVERAGVHPSGLAHAECSDIRGEGLAPTGGTTAGMQGQDGQRVRLDFGSGCAPVAGAWAGADWIPCRDNKWRPVEPGTFPLAHGAPARVGRLRGYGNAINAEAARVFVESFLESEIA